MDDDGPAYRSVARQLRSSLLRGTFDGGTRLPTEAELAMTHRVSRQTVRRAFQDLVAEGLVFRVPGRGTFATEGDGPAARRFGAVQDLLSFSVDTEMRVVAPLHRRVDVAAAGRLQLATDIVHQTEFVRSHDGVDFSFNIISLPPEVARELRDAEELQTKGGVSGETVVSLLDGRLAEPITQAEQSITAVAATEVVAERMGCPPGAPLLQVDRLYLTATDRPVELAIALFLPEHYSYRLRLRRLLS